MVNERSHSGSLRILMLGGSGFIGPHFVHAAANRGHAVTVFNRGIASIDFPPSIERLVGDRTSSLAAIRGRNWDAVIDLAAYTPDWVRTLGEALRGRVDHFTFISTISVYDNPAANARTDESSNVTEYSGAADPYTVTNIGDQYGALKVLCEREAERQFHGRTLVLRPGAIVGPGDFNRGFTYWPMRMERGGNVLIAGDSSAHVQFIDVRDMAEWTVSLIEKRVTGVYNVAGPRDALSLGQLVAAAAASVSATPVLTWVPTSVLMRSGRQMWPLLLWASDTPGFAGTMRINSDRAFAAGLTARPVAVTLQDTIKWYKGQPAEFQGQVVIGGSPKSDCAGWDLQTAPWPDYLEWEKEILTAWHARR